MSPTLAGRLEGAFLAAGAVGAVDGADALAGTWLRQRKVKEADARKLQRPYLRPSGPAAGRDDDGHRDAVLAESVEDCRCGRSAVQFEHGRVDAGQLSLPRLRLVG
jgi:hypothetical protein